MNESSRVRRWMALSLSCVLLAGCIPVSGGGQPAATQRTPTAPAPRVDPEVVTLPSAPPAWEARRVTPSAYIVSAQTYVVKRGDSLRAIAVSTGAGSEAIARANNLARPFVIQPGQRLTIPGGRYHLIREGETGIAIARAYNVDWGRVMAVNALEEPFILRVGQRILIPSSGPETLQESAARFHLDIDDIVTGGEPAIALTDRPVQPTASSARVLPSSAALAQPARLRGAFQWPLQGNVVKRFGPGASGERNEGIKIAAPLDTPVLAAADGVVAYAGSEVPALGGIVIVKHGDGWTTIYGHASQLLVQRGQAVKKGQMIALSGNSGFADRPELHFEMRQGRTPVDPLTRLPAR